VSLAKEYPQFSYGALLEITPELATQAEVIYKGKPDQWYEAQNVFLIGYSQADRKKLIDTHMLQFREALGHYPSFSSSWMIDPWSLAYLKKQYGVMVHQITREQFGTDSYTLYGGPMQYPYWPSDNWALVPEQGNFSQPLIVRQTIMDPVFNYGDRSSSYTSQPNDYAFRHAGLDYFEHLFTQAHNQLGNYTFALIGLENSMGQDSHEEFFRQLEFVNEWQAENNVVATLENFEDWLRSNNNNDVQIYGGNSSENPGEKAWWITTNTYRARLRLSGGVLSLTDLRLYDSRFEDPYLNDISEKLGWWVVPFIIDGSRIDTKNQDSLVVHNDSLINRLEELGTPVGINILGENGSVEVKKENNNIVYFQDQSEIARFRSSDFLLHKNHDQVANLSWHGDNEVLWGFSKNEVGDFIKFSPFINDFDLSTIRKKYSALLFPEITMKPLNAKNSYVFVNNDYAIAGRNPVRLVLFPKDSDDQPVLLGEYPSVVTEAEISKITIHEQHGSNGMQFIDFENDTALKTKITISNGEFSEQTTIYFAPHCPTKIFQCLSHPNQAWWYLRSTISDKIRLMEEKRQHEAQFAE